MASSSSGNGGGETEGEEENVNPFNVLGITADMSFEDVRIKYENQRKGLNADPGFSKIDTCLAWDLINEWTDEGNEEKFSELKRQYFEEKEKAQTPKSLNDNDLGKHFKTLGISADTSFKEAEKKYHRLIFKHHTDKGGDLKISQMISQAWTDIKNSCNEDAERYSELVNEYFGAENKPEILCPEDIDLDKVLQDKTLSTAYRTFFESTSNSNIQVEDNFQWFYTQVFSKVVFEDLRDPLEPEPCENCNGEKFNSLDDHSNAVYYPYYDFVIGGNSEVTWVGFKKYLEGLFGEEVVRVSSNPVVYPVCNPIDIEKQLSLVVESFERNASDLGGFKENLPNFVCERGRKILETLEDITAQLSEMETIFLTISHHDDSCSGEGECKSLFVALLPSLLKVTQGHFKRWGNLSIKVYDSGFCEWSLVLVKAAMHFGDENACVQLAEHLVRKGDHARAHYCFSVIGSCDLNFIGHMLGKKKIGWRLAVLYLAKTDDFKSLRKYGEGYCGGVDSDRNRAAWFLLPLIFRRLQKKNFTRAVELLEMLLPKSMVFRSIQELARELLDDPAFELYECEGIADAVVTEVERVCQGNLLGKVPDIYVEELKDYVLLRGSDYRLNGLTALSGAFHILLGSPEREKYDESISRICEHLLAPLLAEAVLKKQFHLIVMLANCSGSKSSVEKVLTQNMMQWGENDGVETERDLPIGQLYSSALCLLRAVYNYKRNLIPKMVEDLEKAYLFGFGHSKVGESIVSFVGYWPGLHKKLSRQSQLWFLELKSVVRFEVSSAIPDNLEFCWSTILDMKEMGLGSFLKNKLRGEYSKLVVVEKRILMERDYEKIGFLYLDLVSLASGLEPTLCGFIQAISYFLKGMRCADNVVRKYAFLKLIEQVCENMEQIVQNWGCLEKMHVLQAKLIYLLEAHLVLHWAIKEQNEEQESWERSILKEFYPYKVLFKVANRFIYGEVAKVECCGSADPERIKKTVQDWQTLINLRQLCPLSTTNFYSVGDGTPALEFMRELNNQVILEYVKNDMNSNWETFKKSTRYLYTHHLFNELWRGTILPETIPIRSADRIVEPKNLPLVQTQAFQISKGRVMSSGLELFESDRNFIVNRVENMMHWHRIRRDKEAFIDTENRSLNFDGETAYCQLNGVHIDPGSKEISLLLTREDKDDNSPPIFGWTDIAEVFLLGICGGRLSFECKNVASELDPNETLNLPYFPFFEVEFEGFNVNGEMSKELLCGTNYLMTMYHADLLLKILTTGQEVSATFPFLYKDTKNGLLANLPERLVKNLTPVGQRKKAEKLKRMENMMSIHRFWLQAEKGELETEKHGSGEVTFRFGDVQLELCVMRMNYNQDGILVDMKHLLDQDGPEVSFVKDFNKNIDYIMEFFPQFRRLKELAKITLAFQLLHQNKEILEKGGIHYDKLLRNFFLPSWRPYSDCVRGETCRCVGGTWVPAVFQNMTVTNEQKLDYIHRVKRGSAQGKEKGMIDGGKKPILGFEGNKASMFNEPSSSSARKSGTAKGVQEDTTDYDLNIRPLIYGGVRIAISSKSVTKIPPRIYDERAKLVRGTYLYRDKTQRLDVESRTNGYGKTGYKAANASYKYIQAKAAKRKGGEGSSGGSGGGNGDDNDNDKKTKGRKLPPRHFDVKSPKSFPANNPCRVNHIFRGEIKEGHFSKAEDTEETRQLLVDLVNNEKNYKKTEIFGKTVRRWYAKTLSKGKYKGQEIWAYTQGKVIRCGGKNQVPRFEKSLGPYIPTKPNVFPDEEVRIGHIFQNEEGHFSKAEDTKETRKLLTDLVNENQINLVKEERFGTTDKRHYKKIVREGKYKGQELWAYTQANILWDGGINKEPRNKK